MMLYGYSPLRLLFIPSLFFLILNILWNKKISVKFLTNSHKAIVDGTKNIVPIAIACAAAGIIAGTLGITGLGSKISALILTWSFGIPILAL